MLIINADDWGGWRTATDAALACFQQGRISSVSAMVFMEDSERAANLAQQHRLDVGLHLNFSQALTGDTRSVPRLAEFHGAIVRFLKSSKYALLLYHPWLRTQFRAVFNAQLQEFLRLYGRPPSHFDGHQHMHLCTNSLAAALIPAGARVRRSFSFSPGEKGFFNRAYRRLVDRRIAARYQLADYFFSLSQQLRWRQIDRVVGLARAATVELMVHPEWPEERVFLTSDQYVTTLNPLNTKS